MLVLTRHHGEAIKIGDDIRIVVKRHRGDGIKVCIDAPRTVRVLREKLVRKDGDVAVKPGAA